MTTHSHPLPPDDEDALDHALERLVRGDRTALDRLDPDLRATISQMYGWADASGFRDEPLPPVPWHARLVAGWLSRVSSVAAAAAIVVILAVGAFVLIDLTRDDSPSESSFGAGGGLSPEFAATLAAAGILTESEVPLDIQRVFDAYQWPDGYVPTQDDILTRFVEGAGPDGGTEVALFGPGVGHGIIGHWHDCAWYMAWLDAWQADDKQAQAEALDVMTNVLPYHPTINDPSTRQQILGIAESAAQGDSVPVERHIDANDCRDLRFGGPDGD